MNLERVVKSVMLPLIVLGAVYLASSNRDKTENKTDNGYARSKDSVYSLDKLREAGM